MNTKYNVLWIDDEWEDQSIFLTKCMMGYGINLVPFKTRREGMIELERDLNIWDAVLLDAKMLDESIEETPSITGLSNSIHKLHELSVRKKLPYFISTGQTDLIDNNMFCDAYGKYYVKERDDDTLLKDMLKKMDSQPSLQIRNLYADVFETLDAYHYSPIAKSTMTSVLMAMHFPSECPAFEPMLYYNQLRQIVEQTFAVCLNTHIIPEQCKTNDMVNLNQCSLYLAGKDCGIAKVRYGNEGDRLIPRRIELSIKSVIEFGNTHSHTLKLSLEDENLLLEYFIEANSKYTLFGLTLQLCDVILWFRDFFQKIINQDIILQDPKLLVESTVETRKVYVIECDENGNAHCGEIALPYSWHSYVGKEVYLSDIEQNTKPQTKQHYPLFTKNVIPK